MGAMPVFDLTPDTIAEFDRDGVVVLRGVFVDWVERLAEGVAQVMRDPSPLERTYLPEDGGAPFFQDYCNWARIPAFRSFIFDSGAAQIAARLMQSNAARFFHDHVLVKYPGNSTVTPWHHDQPYYCVAGKRTVSFWAPLDPVSREVTLECVAGSHRWTSRGYRPKRFDGSSLYANDDFEEMPDIEGRRAGLPIRAWEMQPGDAVAFDFLTVHGAPANRSTLTRRVFSSRWVGADARFVSRGARGSPPFPHLTLRDGDPFDAPECPVVYRRSGSSC
ncbi:MAG TPA: phytanoyl-CoA dioxygenase family protein [Steroidobacteraceae bacterium]|nr:phytanoyl-CoA dioxygenase family protein [Steroidobacteraceae bacterium]